MRAQTKIVPMGFRTFLSACGDTANLPEEAGPTSNLTQAQCDAYPIVKIAPAKAGPTASSQRQHQASQSMSLREVWIIPAG